MDEFKTEFEKYSSKNPLQKFFVTKFLKDVNSIIWYIDARKILDVGCGIGEVIKSIRTIKKDSSITGVDILEKSLDVAKTKNPDCTFILGDIYSLPFPDKSFDLILNCQVLEHLEEPEKALKELKRVSKKYCLICVPNEPWFSLANLLRLKYINQWGNYPGHVQKWSKKSFGNLLNGFFKRVSIKTSAFWFIALCEKGL